MVARCVFVIVWVMYGFICGVLFCQKEDREEFAGTFLGIFSDTLIWLGSILAVRLLKGARVRLVELF